MKPVKVLSDYQKKFIEDNFKTMTDKEIAEALGFTATWVCLYRSLRKMGKVKRRAKVVSMKKEVYFNVDQRWAWL